MCPATPQGIPEEEIEFGRFYLLFVVLVKSCVIGAHKKQIWIERTAYTSPYTRFFHAYRKEGTVESSKMEMSLVVNMVPAHSSFE